MNHGHAWTYQTQGCRCDPCRAAQARYRKQLRHRHHKGEPTRVPAIGTQRRLQALHAIGWPRKELMQRLGVTDHGTWLTVVDFIRPTTRDKVRALYDELWNKPGPSKWTRTWAANRGYPPPMAWDDDTIDDPDARPACTAHTRDIYGVTDFIDGVAVDRFIAGDLRWQKLTRPERIEAALRMDRAGYSRNVIAERTRLNSETLWGAFRAAAESESGETIAS